MKTLALLRHAKSSWASAGLDDFDRPLNQRGREAARLVGRELRRRKIQFDCILASPAARVRETLKELAEGYGAELDARFDRRFYLAEPSTLLELVGELSEEVRSPLVVGHNPGLHELALQLSGEDGEGLRSEIAGKFPTGALATIELPGSKWSDAGDGQGTITTLILPRLLT